MCDYLRLESLRNQLPVASHAHPQEMAGVCSQMDVLLDKFLQFSAKNAQYRAYLVDRSLLDVEAAARAGRVGLWADPHAVAPWEWRAEKRKGWDAK